MFDKTQQEIFKGLVMPSDRGGAEANSRIEILATMVFDLLTEVEALRKVVLEARQPAYGRAYEETVYLTHNSAGPSSGLEKLLALFYPRESEDGDDGRAEQRTWRECLLLRRLGLSEEEILAYKERAQKAEFFT